MDYDDERCGTATLFLTGEPLAGHRHIPVTAPRTAVDVVKARYLQAERLVLVIDHLNTPKAAARYQAFEPAVARALSERLEIHYPPSMAAG